MAKLDVKKEVRYLSKDFQGFRNDLIDFAKIYFPNSYNDFNESSPGMMFIEMAAYVGDVLSYYVDNQFKESLLAYAEEETNILRLAQTLGYQPKLTSPALVDLDVFIVLPSDLTDPLNPKPDMTYAPILSSGMGVSSTSGGSMFNTTEEVDFRNTGSAEISVYETNADGAPTRWLFKKKVQAQAGITKTFDHTFTSPEKFVTLELPDRDVIEIISAIDSDGEVWYQTPYLAQDTMFVDTSNDSSNDPELAQYSDDAPFLLRLRKTSRRFVQRINNQGKVELRFGSGVSDNPDDEIIPSPSNVGSQLPGSPSKIDHSFDPSNFLYTRAYGSVPTNTTITFTYRTGGGIDSNVPQGDLKTVNSVTYNLADETTLNSVAVDKVKTSLAVNNTEAATGGRGIESIEEIRMNAMAHFATQNRAVTKEDYITRVYSLPSKYGNVAKVYIVQDEQTNQADNSVVTTNNSGKGVKEGGDTSSTPRQDGTYGDGNVVDAGFVNPMKGLKTNMGPARIPNPLALNFYTLGYTSNKKLIKLNPAVQENLKQYLSQYRMLTDAVNIKDAYIINIGVDFQISVLKNYNKRDIVVRCIDRIKEFFDIDKWQINQPIVKGDLIYQMSLVEGVQNVIEVNITNKWDSDEGYSGNVYDMKEATRNEIIYPSADPSIFELKYFEKDIEGMSI